MEFVYENYKIQYIPTSTHFSLILEEVDTGNVYTSMCSKQDFPQYQSVGGLEFVSKIVLEALKQTNIKVYIDAFTNDATSRNMYITYVGEFSTIRIRIALIQKMPLSELEDFTGKLKHCEEHRKNRYNKFSRLQYNQAHPLCAPISILLFLHFLRCLLSIIYKLMPSALN